MRMTLIFVACSVLCAAIFAAPAQTDPDVSWNRKAAAAYLDQRTTSWTHNGAIDHGTFCISCHTALPYALARSVLHTELGEQGPSPTERRLLESVTKRVRLWKVVQPFLSGPTESRGTESVINALILVCYEARNTTLSADTQQALDIMWAQQLKSGDKAGAWPWFSLGNEPWESPDSQYWGATLAAVAIGTVPKRYRTAPEIQDNVKLLKTYLQQDEREQSLLNRLALLWASTRLPGLLSPDQQKSIVMEVLTKQHPDGGWSASDLIPATWKRHDGTPQATKSDGYGTGLVAYFLEQAGVPRTREELKKALGWLEHNQDRATGAWAAYSLNKQRDPASDAGKFMDDAATAYAILALSRSGA